MMGELLAIGALLSYGAMLHKVYQDRLQQAQDAKDFDEAIRAATTKPEMVIPTSSGLADVLKNAANLDRREES